MRIAKNLSLTHRYYHFRAQRKRCYRNNQHQRNHVVPCPTPARLSITIPRCLSVDLQRKRQLGAWTVFGVHSDEFREGRLCRHGAPSMGDDHGPGHALLLLPGSSERPTSSVSKHGNPPYGLDSRVRCAHSRAKRCHGRTRTSLTHCSHLRVFFEP